MLCFGAKQWPSSKVGDDIMATKFFPRTSSTPADRIAIDEPIAATKSKIASKMKGFLTCKIEVLRQSGGEAATTMAPPINFFQAKTADTS